MESGIQRVSLGLIDRDPSQPRTEFAEEALQQLAKSIQDNGLLQPVTLCKGSGGRFIIVAGERRFRAVKSLGWSEIPAIVMDVDQNGFRKMQLIENVVREPLNALEFAQGVQRMLSEGLTEDEIGAAIGRDAGYVRWMVQILKCNEQALHLLAKGQLKVWVAWHLSRLSVNGQFKALRIFQMHNFSAGEMVALCERIYAEEHQSAMFDEAVLTSNEVHMLRSFEAVYTRLFKMLDRLQRVETSKRGTVSQLKLTGAEVRELMARLRWLEKMLRRKISMEGGENAEGSDSSVSV